MREFSIFPTLTYYPGNASFAYHPNDSTSTIKANVPAPFLKNGENVIEITPHGRSICISRGRDSSSTMTYDALSFEESPPRASTKNGIDVQLVPTIFYRQTESGLSKVVEAFVHRDSATQAGEADLEVANRHDTAKISPREFGEQRVQSRFPNGAPNLQLRSMQKLNLSRKVLKPYLHRRVSGPSLWPHIPT